MALFRFITLLFVSQLIFNSCASLAPRIQKGTLPRIFDSSSINGLMVGTISIITTDNLTWGRYYIKYNMQDTSSNISTFSIDILPKGISKYEPTYSIGDTLVFEYVLEHPPGLYKFSTVTYSIPSLQGYAPKEDYSNVLYPEAVEIEKGKISYAGELIIKKHEKHKAYVIDKYHRDIPRLSKEYTNVDWKLLKEFKLKNTK